VCHVNDKRSPIINVISLSIDIYMKQLIQKLEDRQMQAQEVPPPVLGEGAMLIKNHYSLISPGSDG
jgi:hypothetical protein